MPATIVSPPDRVGRSHLNASKGPEAEAVAGRVTHARTAQRAVWRMDRRCVRTTHPLLLEISGGDFVALAASSPSEKQSKKPVPRFIK
jgi:predicted alpha/beta-fold hydrolase